MRSRRVANVNVLVNSGSASPYPTSISQPIGSEYVKIPKIGSKLILQEWYTSRIRFDYYFYEVYIYYEMLRSLYR